MHAKAAAEAASRQLHRAPLRSGEPPFYDTRYHYDNPDGLLTRIVRADGSTVDKQFEIDLRPDASPIERGNLRLLRHTPGAGGGDTPELVRRYEYLPGFGCTCGQAFVTRETDPRGSVRSTGYDDRGNPLLVVERDGGRTENSYNAFGDLALALVAGGEQARHLRVLRPAWPTRHRDPGRRRLGDHDRLRI